MVGIPTGHHGNGRTGAVSGEEPGKVARRRRDPFGPIPDTGVGIVGGADVPGFLVGHGAGVTNPLLPGVQAFAILKAPAFIDQPVGNPAFGVQRFRGIGAPAALVHAAPPTHAVEISVIRRGGGIVGEPQITAAPVVLNGVVTGKGGSPHPGGLIHDVDAGRRGGDDVRVGKSRVINPGRIKTADGPGGAVHPPPGVGSGVDGFPDGVGVHRSRLQMNRRRVGEQEITAGRNRRVDVIGVNLMFGEFGG